MNLSQSNLTNRKDPAMTKVLVLAYLGAIVVANLISAHYGPSASIYNAFFLIGLTLTTRDRLHDAWQQGNRVRNMALLIASGSALSYLTSKTIHGAAPPNVVAKIALASCLAFAVAESCDAIAYHLLRDRPWLERSNTSNIVSSFLDSAVFVTVAFGWAWPIIFGQLCAKVAGGYVWSLILRRRQQRKIAYAS